MSLRKTERKKREQIKPAAHVTQIKDLQEIIDNLKETEEGRARARELLQDLLESLPIDMVGEQPDEQKPMADSDPPFRNKEDWESTLNVEHFRNSVKGVPISDDPENTQDIESLWAADRVLYELREVTQDRLRKRIWPGIARTGSVSIRPAIDHGIYKLVAKCEGSTADIRRLRPDEIRLYFGLDVQQSPQTRSRKRNPSFTASLLDEKNEAVKTR